MPYLSLKHVIVIQIATLIIEQFCKLCIFSDHL